MREYKFRAKIKNPHADEWVYGYLVSECYINEKNKLGYTPIRKETVGQYTGLHDKNGKEIYEGDIIEFSYDMFVGNFDTFAVKGKIVFEEGAFYVKVFENERITGEETYLLYSINLDDIEVIGNIYENRELLNETNR